MKASPSKARKRGRKPAASRVAIDPDEILPEYDFTGGVRGKYAARYAEGTNVVLLDADVAAAFPSSKTVNVALRALAEIARRQQTKPRRQSA